MSSYNLEVPRKDTMSTAETAYHHGDLPAALLAAVEEIIDEQGYVDVSLREAARRAGVSHSAPAYHFGDKEGMLVAFCRQGFDVLYAGMLAAYEAHADESSVDRMNGIGEAYVRFALEHRAHFEIMFRAGLDHVAHESLHEGSGQVFALLLQAIGELQEEGHFADQKLFDVALYLWSIVHGFSTILVDGSVPPALDGVDLTMFLDGVLRIAVNEQS
jgi:AcrR family transcriptional regulator